MRFHLEMDCDNSAFEPELKGADTIEVARILRDLAGKLESQGQRAGRCWDANGNPVGDWAFVESPAEVAERHRRTG